MVGSDLVEEGVEVGEGVMVVKYWVIAGWLAGDLPLEEVPLLLVRTSSSISTAMPVVAASRVDTSVDIGLLP